MCLAKSPWHGRGRLRWLVLSPACLPGQVFHDVAYKAKDRADLVAGIDEFLDQVTVLPPGEWDPSIRIEPPKNLPSQVGAGRQRGRGLRGDPESQGPSLTQTRSQTSQRLQTHLFSLFAFYQEKRKMRGVLGDSDSHSKPEKHSGPELERTGRCGL